MWISWALRPAAFAAFLFADICAAVVIICLAVVSARNAGFTTVSDDTLSIFSSSLEIQLLWTTLPTLLLRLLAIFWDVITAAAVDREPFVELQKPTGTSAKRSILLDYRTKFAPLRCIAAWKNRHFPIGIAIFLCIVLSLVVTPLASHLFVAQPTSYTSDVSVLFSQPFHDNNLNSSMRWETIFDQVAAIRIYNGNPLPWTNVEFAFPPFSVAATSNNARGGPNVTVDTTAYAAYLDCQTLSDYSIQLDSAASDRSSGHVRLTATDRGCDVSQDFTVASLQQTYFKTTSKIDCSARGLYSRLLFTIGSWSDAAPQLLANVSFISCATGYRAVPGSLEVSYAQPTGAPDIVSFSPSGSPADATRPGFWRVIEPGILGPTDFTPGVEWSTTSFGRLVLEYSEKHSADRARYLDAENLSDAIRIMFNAVYSTAVATYSFERDGSSATVGGRATQSVTRLVVVGWVAAVLVVVLASCAADAVWLWLHTKRNGSILGEEPSGLFSYAGLLYESNVLDIAGEVCKFDAYDGKLIDLSNQRWDLGDAKCSTTLKGRRPVIKVEPPKYKGSAAASTQSKQ
ncbi:hypothetical protein MPH_00231 [Macrophomina phaseolina MS6]|uniref:Uncharacterized protein n=1 Tax=Macrophomina phaseolina (strain MS6) TaxID=1126212 RepID=K2RIV4_MACPH|nr:hypothetical protein MPH_00231 [Macrophomina phaseolina MS6]